MPRCGRCVRSRRARFDALVAEGRRKPDVEDRDIRRGVADALDDVVRVSQRPRRDVARLVEETHQALAQQDGVLDEDDAQRLPAA